MADVRVNISEEKELRVRVREYFPPHRSGGEAKDVDYLIQLVAIALDEYQHRLGIPKNKRMVARSSWPKNDVEKPGKDLVIVTQRVIERKPGNTSPDRERRPFRPQQRQDAQPHPDADMRAKGMMVMTHGWWMDNILEFRVQSANLKRADELALFFQDFMEAYRFYFKDTGGMQEMVFRERTADEVEIIGGTEVYIRPIRFFVRTELISHSVGRRLDKLHVRYDAGPALKETVVDADNGISDFSVDRGKDPGDIR